MKMGITSVEVSLETSALDRLMPMHLCVSATGQILSCGPTLLKLLSARSFVGQRFFERFEVRRPSGIAGLADLRNRAGERLYMTSRCASGLNFRGIATPMADGQGVLLNLSFGIGIIDAVRHHGLTNADFAATDLAIELLYLVEAKSAVMEELRQLNLRLQSAKTVAEEQAHTDILTGLRNRRAMDIALERVILEGKPFGLMHIDLDFFKAVNDTFGHAAGDHVLRQVADVLTAEMRIGDTVARVGGDEFVIVLPGIYDPARLEVIADRIIARLSEPMLYESKPCHISASVGLTVSKNYTSPNASQMLADVDQALYASKNAGRGTARLHQGQNIVRSTNV